MPITPKKSCSRCKRVLTRDTYCPACEKIVKARRRLNDNREPAHKRGYNSTWHKVRNQKLNTDPLCECERCAESGALKTAELVHHIKPVETHPELRLDMDNLMSITRRCHEIEHGRRKGRRTPGGQRAATKQKRSSVTRPEWMPRPIVPVVMVSGPPASGKTTYVKNMADNDDMVLDLDSIANELGQNKRGFHFWDRSLMLPALKKRNERLASLSKQGEYKRAFFIVSGADKKHRKWWINKLNAESIVLETPADVCRKRLKRDGRMSDNLIKVIAEWWLGYERIEGEKILRHGGAY